MKTKRSRLRLSLVARLRIVSTARETNANCLFTAKRLSALNHSGIPRGCFVSKLLKCGSAQTPENGVLGRLSPRIRLSPSDCVAIALQFRQTGISLNFSMRWIATRTASSICTGSPMQILPSRTKG
jgi:hypothetical protein